MRAVAGHVPDAAAGVASGVAGVTPRSHRPRPPPVPRQNSVRADTIDDSAKDEDSPRLDASPPRSPPADHPLGHALPTRPRGRESGPSPTARHPGRSTTPRHPARRPALLDPAAPLLERLGRGPRHRRAGYCRSLAPRGLPHLLELALQARQALWPPSPPSRGPRSHPKDGHGEFLGRPPHPRRTALPRLRGLRALRIALPSQAASRSEGRTDLDVLPPEPPKRHRRHGLLLRAHGDVPRLPGALHHPPRSAGASTTGRQPYWAT